MADAEKSKPQPDSPPPAEISWNPRHYPEIFSLPHITCAGHNLVLLFYPRSGSSPSFALSCSDHSIPNDIFPRMRSNGTHDEILLWRRFFKSQLNRKKSWRSLGFVNRAYLRDGCSFQKVEYAIAETYLPTPHFPRSPPPAASPGPSPIPISKSHIAPIMILIHYIDPGTGDKKTLETPSLANCHLGAFAQELPFHDDVPVALRERSYFWWSLWDFKGNKLNIPRWDSSPGAQAQANADSGRVLKYLPRNENGQVAL